MLRTYAGLLLFCFWISVVSGGQAWAITDEATELWTGSLFTSTYRAGLCVSSQGTLRGVLHLRLKNGKVDVYHITGRVWDDGKIEAQHSSGHKFRGNLTAPDRVEGVISLKSGLQIELSGRREHGIPLAPEDCAPLPQP